MTSEGSVKVQSWNIFTKVTHYPKLNGNSTLMDIGGMSFTICTECTDQDWTAEVDKLILGQQVKVLQRWKFWPFLPRLHTYPQ